MTAQVAKLQRASLVNPVKARILIHGKEQFTNSSERFFLGRSEHAESDSRQVESELPLHSREVQGLLLGLFARKSFVIV